MNLRHLVRRIDEQRVPEPFRSRLVQGLRANSGQGAEAAAAWLDAALLEAPGLRRRAAANSNRKEDTK